MASSATPYTSGTFPLANTGSVSSATGFLSLRMIGRTQAFAHSVFYDSFQDDAVPEPGTWALIGAGLAGLAALRRRR